MMLTSGSVGRENLRLALEEAKRLFAKKFGTEQGRILVDSTRHLKPVVRLQELDRLLGPYKPAPMVALIRKSDGVVLWESAGQGRVKGMR